MISRRPGDSQPQCFVSRERYFELLEGLLGLARSIQPPPDSIVGVKRSGLFPAVYLSQQLELPMFVNTELAAFPYPRLRRPLVVDTTAWTGESLRRTLARLERRGVANIYAAVMLARADPPPAVPGLRWLETATHVPRFWYYK